MYGGLLTAFFETHPHPQLSWMHDIASKRYGAAAEALTIVDGATAELAQKQLIASIAKLSAVADFKTQPSAGTELVSRIDDELDNIEAQRVLASDLSSASKSASAFVKDNSSSLGDRPAFQRLLENDVERLFAGDALDAEGLVDVLTLKDVGEREGDGALAIERLWHDYVSVRRLSFDLTTSFCTRTR